MGLLDGARLVAVDTETTGFDAGPSPELDHVVEVACVPVDGGAIGAPWSSLVNPGRAIPPGASAVHGIRDADVRSAPSAAEVAPLLEECCAGRVLVFHHAAFDLPFLQADFRLPLFDQLLDQVDLPLFGPGYVDTLGLARGLGDAGSNALGALAKRLGVEPGTAHSATGDALTTARVLLQLAGRWERERGVRSLDELARKSREAAPVFRRVRG